MGDKVTRSVSFDSVEHKRILELGKATGNFSKVVQLALAAYFDLNSGVTLGMIYTRLGDIERKLDSGVVVGGGAVAQDDDEGDVLSADILGAFG